MQDSVISSPLGFLDIEGHAKPGSALNGSDVNVINAGGAAREMAGFARYTLDLLDHRRRLASRVGGAAVLAIAGAVGAVDAAVAVVVDAVGAAALRAGRDRGILAGEV